eukprot:gene3285-18182_t
MEAELRGARDALRRRSARSRADDFGIEHHKREADAAAERAAELAAGLSRAEAALAAKERGGGGAAPPLPDRTRPTFPIWVAWARPRAGAAAPPRR